MDIKTYKTSYTGIIIEYHPEDDLYYIVCLSCGDYVETKGYPPKALVDIVKDNHCNCY
jgi:hypothetical protein